MEAVQRSRRLERRGVVAATFGSRKAAPYLLVLPSILLLVSLIVYPIGFALVNSFRLWNLQSSPVPLGFVGFKNYQLVFQATPFLSALRNTVILSVAGTIIQFWLGMGIALLLNSHLKGMTVARAILIMPTTIAAVVTGFLFRYMYYEGSGLITWLLSVAGFPVPAEGILGSAWTALAGILLADIWQWTPFFAIILYAALLGIPDEIIEMARVEGASALILFTRIILPLLSPHSNRFDHNPLHAALQHNGLSVGANTWGAGHGVTHTQLQPLPGGSGQLQHRNSLRDDVVDCSYRNRPYQCVLAGGFSWSGVVT